MRKRKSVIFVISDFIGNGFDKSFGALCSRHEVVAIHVVDQMESKFPEIGHVLLKDLESKETILLNSGDPEVNKAMNDKNNERKNHLKQLCRKHSGSYLCISTNEDYLDSIVQFFLKQHTRRRRKR